MSLLRRYSFAQFHLLRWQNRTVVELEHLDSFVGAMHKHQLHIGSFRPRFQDESPRRRDTEAEFGV